MYVEERLNICPIYMLIALTVKTHMNFKIQDAMRVSTWKAITITTSRVQTCFYFYLHKLKDV